MQNNELPKHKPKSPLRWISLMLVLAAILVVVFGLQSDNSQAATNVQPALLAMAAEQPDATVRVIVQKNTADADIGELITSLEGTLVKDLSIINATVAKMPASKVRQLASSEAVRWVSLDGVVENAGKPPKDPSPNTLPNNYYLDTLDVRRVWDMGIDGSGIGVAVIDSGITVDNDLSNLTRRISFNPNAASVNDTYGHGTHVAGIIAGSGADSGGLYMGVAPGVTLLGLKISDEQGMAYESDTVAAMQWALDNKDIFNIRVVNMSVNSTVEQSYHTSPMDAAAEILWFNGIVVVASSGNWNFNSINPVKAAPANDPFIITVGASNENDTTKFRDDFITIFSAFGTTTDGFDKPDIIAPGKNIYSVLSANSDWDAAYPDRVVLDGEYYRLSGTSMAAPIVSGAAALLLQSEPNLTPDQVKYRLINASNRISGLLDSTKYPYLDIYAAVTDDTTESANTGIEASQLLWTGDDPINWDSVNWGSVNWGSVNWGSVNWGSVNWGSVNWGSVSWDN